MQSDRRSSSLFRRCLKCPDDTPTCPTCATDETCLLQSKSCNVCQSAKCVKSSSVPGGAEAPPKSSTPAIAGGVAGGVLFIIILTFVVWWFCIRKKRQEWDEQAWSERDQSIIGVEKRDQSGLSREARQSTRSMHSIASTVRTRASNVIQIAYIPGVTNRSPTESPGLLIPPVPAMPMPSQTNSAATSPNLEQDRHFFMPNLRDSSYSDLSHRQSLSPSLTRASVGTTLFRGQAQVSPRPAQQALRGKAAVVTVNKSGNNTPSECDTPEESTTPQISQTPKSMMNSPIVGRHVTARPIQVKKSNSQKNIQVPTSANLKAVAANHNASGGAERVGDRSEDETDSTTRLISPPKRPQHESTTETIIEDTPTLKQTQFTTFSSSSSSSSSSGISAATTARRTPSYQRPSPAVSRSSLTGSTRAGPSLSRKHHKSGSLNSLIEEAMSRAARDPVHGGLGSISETNNHGSSHPLMQREQVRSDSASLTGPFSDAHEVRDSTSP